MSENGSQKPGVPERAGEPLGGSETVGLGELEATADGAGDGVGEPSTVPTDNRTVPKNKESGLSRFLFIQLTTGVTCRVFKPGLPKPVLLESRDYAEVADSLYGLFQKR